MRLPLLALALFTLCAVPSHAQQQSLDMQSVSTNMPFASTATMTFPGPTRPLRPATTPNPSFPLHVNLRLHDNHFNYFWSDFRGQGQLVANNTTYNFRYECPNTFRRRSAFQARWSKDGKKLDILLQKPDSSRTETCTLKIIDHS
jgi:hypothetical protein